MLTLADLLYLPYTPDLNQAGIAHLCRCLATQQYPGDSLSYGTMRQMAGEVACKMAFQRHLDSLNIAYDLLRTNPFTEPELFEITIGGRHCKLIVTTLFQRDQIRQMRNNPEAILSTYALAPVQRINTSGHKREDLYIFTFLTGLVAAQENELQRAYAADQPVELMHMLPDLWNKGHRWSPLSKVIIKSEPLEPILIEFGGRGEDRGIQKEEILVPSQTRIRLLKNFYSLAYLRTKTIPTGRIGVHSTALAQTHVIFPRDWGNVWIYGMEIIFSGFITVGEYRSRCAYLPPGSRTFQIPRTTVPFLSIPLTELHPLQDLFTAALEWQAEKEA
jgi:hypothetical protein